MQSHFHSSLKILPFFLIIVIYSCSPASPSLFSKKSPHEKYGQKLKDAGLNQTALGALWFSAAEQSLSNSNNISNLPYKEAGYFSAEKPKAISFGFKAKRGEKISAKISLRPVENTNIYLDLWLSSLKPGEKPEYITSAPEGTNSLEYSPKKPGDYILRLQPELLKSIEYTISIISEPSLAYPLAAPGNNHIKSVFGVDREGGSRKHEGIDMFAAHRTPLLAAANGTITRVEQTPIGGKVIWLSPDEKDISLYYAHLDEQLVSAGQRVNAGDTIGLMGNTGNAAGGSPHLHFGIYTRGGAIDPYPFVYKQNIVPAKISADTSFLSRTAKITTRNAKFRNQTADKGGLALQINTPVIVEAASENKFRIRLPDGTPGFVNAEALSLLDKPIKKINLPTSLPLLDSSAQSALTIRVLTPKETINVLGEFNNYYYIEAGKDKGWIIKK